MAYHKRTENEKREFIAKVFNLLDSKGETKKYSHLENTFDLEKQYQVAQRYVREMGLSFDEVSKAPNSDFEIAAASEEDIIKESEEDEGFTEETEVNEDAEETDDSEEVPTSGNSRTPSNKGRVSGERNCWRNIMRFLIGCSVLMIES